MFCLFVVNGGVQNSQASRPEGAEAHSPGQRPTLYTYL